MLPADVCRCMGGGCANADQCLRYVARHDKHPRMSYIQGGAFVDGACLYFVPLGQRYAEETPRSQDTNRITGSNVRLGTEMPMGLRDSGNMNYPEQLSR